MAGKLLERTVAKLDQLKRVFTVFPQLTDMAAQMAVHDTFGIIMRGLDLESAGLWQNALHLKNVHAEVVDESKLPSFSPAKIARQIELGPSHLTLYDPASRKGGFRPGGVWRSRRGVASLASRSGALFKK